MQRDWDAAELVRQLRRGNSAAADEFTRRFWPLLVRSAARFGVDPRDRADAVGSVISDVMLHLIRCGANVPENLAAYSVRALRNRLLMELRRRSPRPPHGTTSLENAADELNTRAVDAFLLPEVSAPRRPAAVALRRIYSRILPELTENDRVLLGYVVEHLPAREMAAGLRITHSAAKVRAHRLKRRLRTRFFEELALLPPDLGAAVERVLRRSGVRLPSARVPEAFPPVRQTAADDSSKPQQMEG